MKKISIKIDRRQTFGSQWKETNKFNEEEKKNGRREKYPNDKNPTISLYCRIHDLVTYLSLSLFFDKRFW